MFYLIVFAFQIRLKEAKNKYLLGVLFFHNISFFPKHLFLLHFKRTENVSFATKKSCGIHLNQYFVWKTSV